MDDDGDEHYGKLNWNAFYIVYRVTFPYLVLLISGGHCLLAVVRDVDDFLLLGKGLDDAPGDAFDKVLIVLQPFRSL